jgi:hypothetical protein
MGHAHESIILHNPLGVYACLSLICPYSNNTVGSTSFDTIGCVLNLTGHSSTLPYYHKYEKRKEEVAFFLL